MSRPRTGYVYEDSERGIWLARVQFTDPQTGRRRQLRRKVKNKTEGHLLVKKLLKMLDARGTGAVDAERLTFKRLAEIYEERRLQPPVYKGGTKVSGLRSYKDQRHRLASLVKHFGHRRVSAITHSDLEVYKSTVLGRESRFGGEVSLATAHRSLALLRSVLNFARRQGWLERTPFEMGESLIQSAAETKRDRILSREEEERLLAQCTGPRAHIRAVVICAIDTGMRRGELLKLKWSDVDFRSGLIRVRALNTKTLRERVVGMTERLREELVRLWDLAPPGDYLVFGINDNFATAFKTARDKAGLVDFRFHDCRATCITRWIRQGMAPLEAMRVSGHATPAMLYRYTRATEETARRAAEALDRYRAEGERSEAGMIN